MEKFVVMSFATLHKDVLVEAEDYNDAREKVEQAFADGRLRFTMDDFVTDLNDYDVMTLEDAEALDGLKMEDCERL